MLKICTLIVSSFGKKKKLCRVNRVLYYLEVIETCISAIYAISVRVSEILRHTAEAEL